MMRYGGCLPALLAALMTVHGASAEFPLRDLAVREARELTTWGFQAVPPGDEDTVDWSSEDHRAARATWPPVTIPAVWDQPAGQVTTHPTPSQIGWFHTTVAVPPDWDGDIVLCFLAAQFITDVFANGTYLATHRGGYTPFLVPLPEARPGHTLEITVRIDNRLNNETVPKAVTGWELYGGLTREVYLLHRPPARPEQIRVITTPAAAGNWSVALTAETIGTPAGPLRIRVLDGTRTVAEGGLADWASGVDTELLLQAPRLWSPEQPNLYTLELHWDQEHLRFPVGLRQLTWTGGRLMLNGEPLWLQGFGQHESWPLAGPILSSAARREDLLRMKTIFRANSYRTGHYPNHPEIFHLADELGLLVFTEVPAWQNHPSILARDDIWEQWLDPQITAMLTFHRNHPSVFAWGVQNETGGAHVYIRRARERILELDSTRPVSAIIASTGDMAVYGMTDLGARNLHYGWYHARSVYALRQSLAANLKAAGEVPIWIAELGGRAQPGRLGGGYSDDVRGTETYQDKMTRFGLQYSTVQADAIVGISLWTWSDYWRGGRPHDHGILAEDRSPKLAAYTAANLMHADTRALAMEVETVIPVGEAFRADLAVFSRIPAPGRELTLTWQVRRGSLVIEQGAEKHALEAGRVTSFGQMHWIVPPTIAPGLHHLYLELHDGTDLLHSQALPFEPGETGKPGVLQLPPPPDDQLATVTIAGMRLAVYPHIGLLLAMPEGTWDLDTGSGMGAVTITSAEVTQAPWE